MLPQDLIGQGHASRLLQALSTCQGWAMGTVGLFQDTPLEHGCSRELSRRTFNSPQIACKLEQFPCPFLSQWPT